MGNWYDTHKRLSEYLLSLTQLQVRHVLTEDETQRISTWILDRVIEVLHWSGTSKKPPSPTVMALDPPIYRAFHKFQWIPAQCMLTKRWMWWCRCTRVSVFDILKFRMVHKYMDSAELAAAMLTSTMDTLLKEHS